MFQQLALAIAKNMVLNQIIHENQLPIYRYGLELLLSSIAGILSLAIISLIGGEPFGWLPYLVGFIPIRLMGGGYHAQSHRGCISVFSLLYVIDLIMLKCFIVPLVIWTLICAVNVFILFVFSPLEANNKPLSVVQRRINRNRSLFLGLLNFFVVAIYSVLQSNVPMWLNFYFAGSSMACLSIMMAVIKKHVERGDYYENGDAKTGC